MDFRGQLHTDVEEFEVIDNQLQFGSRSLRQLESLARGTPFYAYSAALLERRIDQLRRALPGAVGLHYAIKANPMPEVVSLMSSLVEGLDVASGGELEIALATGRPAQEISFAGPGKTDAELDAAISAGITINVESPTELERIDRLAHDGRRKADIAIRVNPAFELKSSGMKMAGGPKQFGIDEERVPDVLDELPDLRVNFVGFHIFSGSQNLRDEAICESQQQTVRLALELAGRAPSPPRWINIGGGFGIPYFPGDRPLSLERIGTNLAELSESVESQLPGCRLVLELGRYLVGEAGIYVCRVVDIKESRGRLFLVTDGGLHHHLAASGNFGQVIRKNYPVILGTNVYPTESETCSVVGPLCTPLDLLAEKIEIGKAEVGDLVVVFQSGAYGFSASPHRFLGHPPPRELFVA